MFYPTLEEVRQLHKTEVETLSERGKRPLLPLYRDILADMETPVSAYCKIASGPYSFLLESVAGGERIARYSFIGIDPYLIMKHRGEIATLHRIGSGRNESDLYTIEKIHCHDPLDFIQAELEQYRLINPTGIAQDKLPSFHGGAVGYLAYEIAARFEHLPVPEKDEL